LSIGHVGYRRNGHPLLPTLPRPDEARIFPKSYDLPELRSYRRIVCEEVVTLEHERSAHSARLQPDRNHPRLLRQRFHGRRRQALGIILALCREVDDSLGHYKRCAVLTVCKPKLMKHRVDTRFRAWLCHASRKAMPATRAHAAMIVPSLRKRPLEELWTPPRI
jgi:hypothetical protein